MSKHKHIFISADGVNMKCIDGCSPSPDTAKSFFDMPIKEKKAIIKKAAQEANKEQAKFMASPDTVKQDHTICCSEPVESESKEKHSTGKPVPHSERCKRIDGHDIPESCEPYTAVCTCCKDGFTEGGYQCECRKCHPDIWGKPVPLSKESNYASTQIPCSLHQCGRCGAVLAEKNRALPVPLPKECPNGYVGENMTCCRCVRPIPPTEALPVPIQEWETRFDKQYNPMVKVWGETPEGEYNMRNELEGIKKFIKAELSSQLTTIREKLFELQHKTPLGESWEEKQDLLKEMLDVLEEVKK